MFSWCMENNFLLIYLLKNLKSLSAVLIENVENRLWRFKPNGGRLEFLTSILHRYNRNMK